jgi:hypothetical protein
VVVLMWQTMRIVAGINNAKYKVEEKKKDIYAQKRLKK